MCCRFHWDTGFPGVTWLIPGRGSGRDRQPPEHGRGAGQSLGDGFTPCVIKPARPFADRPGLDEALARMCIRWCWPT